MCGTVTTAKWQRARIHSASAGRGRPGGPPGPPLSHRGHREYRNRYDNHNMMGCIEGLHRETAARLLDINHELATLESMLTASPSEACSSHE